MPDSTPDTPVVVNQQNFDTENLAPALNTIVEESKAGYKTTEFWVAIIVSLLTVLDGIPLPEKYEGIVAGAIGAAYIISRGIAKKGVPVIAPADEQLPPA